MPETGETYELADEPPPRPPARPASEPGAQLPTASILRPSCSPEASAIQPPGLGQQEPIRAAPILSYARPGTLNTRPEPLSPAGRGAVGDPDYFRRQRRREFTTPIVLIGTGLLAVIAAGWGISGSFLSGVQWASIGLAWDALIIFTGIVLGSRLVDIETEAIGAVALQTTAVAAADSAVLWPLVWLDDGSGCGMLAGWVMSTGMFCWLLSYFFELDVLEVLILVALILLLRVVANLAWMGLFGEFGYLPI